MNNIMKFAIVSTITLVAFLFGYSLARFQYIGKADQELTNINTLIKVQRDICYDVLNGRMLQK